MKKNKYEISLWEDKLVPESGTEENIVPEHYEEEKICIIGSDTMTSQARALEPKLVKNINGTNKLTFKLYYIYIDNETGKKVQNPFISLLINERKVKCKWDNRWYDFVIKNIQEDSNGKSISYTCEDLYINELSKTGFNLKFDQELNNNQGTAQELAEKVLEGTDWVIDTDNSDHILQTIEEALYKATLNQDLDAKDKNGSTKKINSGSVIYIFYSVVNEKSNYIQFIYNTSYETENNSQLLKENNCYSIEMDWAAFESCLTQTTDKKVILTFSDYRGKRLVRKQLQEFNNALDRNCYVFKDKNNNKVLGYSTIEYKDPTVVLNLISNPKEFTDTNGWRAKSLNWELYPHFYNNSSISDDYTSTTYLKFIPDKEDIYLFNSGLQDSAGYLEDGLQAGQKYICRIKAYKDNNNTPSKNLVESSSIDFLIFDYFKTISTTGTPAHNKGNYCRVTSKNSTTDKEGDPLIELEIEITNSIPKKDLTAGYYVKYSTETKSKIAYPGIYIKLPTCWVKEIQFYQRVEGLNGTVIHLGDLDTESIGQTYYKYFLSNNSYEKEEDIKYLYCGTKENASYLRCYEENGKYVQFEKIRSITAKNSNRFNILQSIAETFQCWIRFNIDHDNSTGKIIYKNGLPQKTVYFKENIGEELGYGFVYGIDLKTISRSIDSSQITSKVIVSPNITECADDGICEIAKSDYNENGENYIYDFGYYISQGLLNSGELNKFLYLSDNNKSAFYPSLKKINSNYNKTAKEIAAKKTEFTKQTSLQEVYNQYVTSAEEQIATLQDNLCKLTGISPYNKKKILTYLSKKKDYTEAQNYYTTLTTTQNKLNSYRKVLSRLDNSVKNLTDKIKKAEKNNEDRITEKKKLEEEFYKKFSRFIQEGSWTSQDYIDENLYYLDAQSVAYTSSRPKISYNISVIRLSALDEYKGKKFNVGDISFIEDTEFFGYVSGPNAWKTPYREKVLISEVTFWFDSPEKDTFTIQNYKTQFEDLFQRITATTQSLQYSTGEYNRASSVVEGKGVINTETLQNSININNELVFKSQNEEIFQDSTGLTLTDKRDPSKRTKLTSGGLFISTDGGITWKNAVRGEGIATQYLTAGAINVNDIAIYDGAHATFRWDKNGINAFDVTRNENDELIGINPNTFVRFDQYGIYGIKSFNSEDNSSYDPQEEINGLSGEDKIWSDASFGLTWKGFFLKNKGTSNQQIEISTVKDICITKDNIERIKIGRIDKIEQEDIYGIRLKDNKNTTTLETDDQGQLWLKDKLQIAGVKYQGTKDSSIDEFKIYYSKNEDGTFFKVENPVIENLSSYYELVSSGVSIGNLGANKIKVRTTDREPIEGKTYYEKDVDGSYTIVSAPTKENISNYYEEKDEENKIFNSNNNFIVYEDGRIFANRGEFTGTIHATDGEFTGTIHTTDGEFTGTITALSGAIGGFTIENDHLDGAGTMLAPEGITIKNDGQLIIFDKDGFPIFQANKKEYVLTIDTKAEEGKHYFKKNDNDEYEEITFEVGADITPNTYEEKTSTIFSGELAGASGSFSGSLTALSGTIGGFTINDNNLTSENDFIILNGTEGTVIAENIELGNGAKVKDRISFVEKIKIKTEDTEPIERKTYYEKNSDGSYSIVSAPTKENISNYYEEAEGQTAYLENPTNYNGTVLEAGQLKLKTSGLLEFGDIKISGDSDNPTIHSSLWLIDKDKAIFNNVIAQGGTIENVVFKNSSIQSAGGLMIFKPSFSAHLKSEDSDSLTKIFVIEDSGLQETGNKRMELIEGDKVLVNTSEGTVTSFIDNEVTITFSKKEIDFPETCSITKLYSSQTVTSYVLTIDIVALPDKTYYLFDSTTNQYEVASVEVGSSLVEDQYFELQNKTVLSDSVLIGISSIEANGQNSITTDCNLFRSGLTVTAPSISSKGEITYPKLPNLFCGDLTAIGKTGYGLYGDNVYLNGTLTTTVPSEGEPTYAGVNTLNGVQKSENDTQKIVFWAGSKSDSAEEIQKAPFQVTDRGNLYAKAGTFTDSVFTDSTITGSQIYGADIYTANIHGWNLDKNQSGGLNIYNTSQGIVFKAEKEDSTPEKVLFQINSDKFSTPNKDFISIKENDVIFLGTKYQVQVSDDEIFSLANKKVNDKSYFTLELLGKNENNQLIVPTSSFSFSQTNILSEINGASKLSISNEKISSYENFEAQKDVFFGTSMEYRLVDGGYNLYVK